MTIDKQALREAAEKATPGPWEMEQENIWFTDEDGYTKHLAYVQQGDDVDDKQDHYNTAFIAAANPATMLALLDENLQLQREKDATEAVALALRDDMRQAREKLEAAERSMAEQSAIVAAAEKLVRCKGRYHSELNYRALAKLFGVNTPDLPPMDGESRTVMMPEPFKMAKSSSGLMYYYADEVDKALATAGIKVKE
ncbi:ead/Ea22-like family protein [Salmonella enterica]